MSDFMNESVIRENRIIVVLRIAVLDIVKQLTVTKPATHWQLRQVHDKCLNGKRTKCCTNLKKYKKPGIFFFLHWDYVEFAPSTSVSIHLFTRLLQLN